MNVAARMEQTAAAGTLHALTGYTLVATLMCLAILEHGFLILKVRDSALWNWARWSQLIIASPFADRFEILRAKLRWGQR